MLTSIRVSLYQKGILNSIEEKRVRRPEVLFAGHALSFGVTYTISVGSMETSVNLAGPSPLTSMLVDLTVSFSLIFNYTLLYVDVDLEQI